MPKYRHDGLPYTETVVINCRIPRHLHARIKLLLIDPATGAARPRGWSAVIEEGMELWLASHITPIETPFLRSLKP